MQGNRDAKAESLFARWLLARDEGHAVPFDALIEAHPDQAVALRALHGEHLNIDPDTPDDRVLDTIELREEIGRGAFGRVHRAFDPGLEREVAVKILDPGRGVTDEGKARFLREARILASLDHPNIVRVHAVTERRGRLEIVLELLHGRTLEQVVKETGAMSPTEAARVGLDLCRALAALHATELVHRDLKPANVMRVEGGGVKLLDFGLAHSPSEGSALTAGTPAFMAPEQFDRPDSVDARTDLYALGVLLYFLVTSRYPHEGRTPEALQRAVLEDPPRPLLDLRPDVDRRFAEVVERALRFDPEQRFSSAGELEKGLREVLAGSAPSSSRSFPRAAAFGLVALLPVSLAMLGPVRELFRPVSAAESTAAPRRFQVSAEFFVAGRALPLAAGDTVRGGDGIHCRIRTDRLAHVYLLNEDDAGTLSPMFPIEGVDAGNPLEPGRDHRLPGRADGEEMTWIVRGSGPGTERVLLLAGLEPIPAADELFDLLESPRGSGAADLASLTRETKRRLRSIGGLRKSAASPDGGGPGRLSDAFDRLLEGVAVGEGTVARTFVYRREAR